MIRQFASSLLLLAAFGSPAMAWDDPSKGAAALYSSVCYSVRSGDLQGERLLILNSNRQHFAVLQQTGGEFAFPIWARAEIKDGHLKFTAQDRDGTILAFEGSIASDEVAGKFADARMSRNGNAEFRWRRVSTDRRSTPECQQVAPGAKQ